MDIYIMRIKNKKIHTIIEKSKICPTIIHQLFISRFETFNKKILTYYPVDITNKYYIFPRFACFELINYFKKQNLKIKIHNNVNFDDLLEINMGEMKIEVWKDRIELAEKAFNLLKKNNGLIIKWDTGNGKTVLLSKIITMMKTRTLIITKDSDLQFQMYEDLNKNTNIQDLRSNVQEKNINILFNNGLDDEPIAFLGGKCKKPFNENSKILIAVINSLRKQTSEEFWNQFGLVILDECHCYCSRENSKIFEYMNNKYCLGLSANPQKPWNYKILEYNIGPISDFDQGMNKKNYNAELIVINYSGPDEYTKVIKNINGIMSVALMVEQFMNDEYRNNLLCDLIYHAYTIDQFGFVFGLKNNFIEKLHKYFIEKHPEIKCSVFNANTSHEEKQFAKNEAEIVFTNYSKSEGLNIPRMRFIIHASPYKTNGNQITGRTFRENMDEMRRIYDLIDIRTPIKSMYNERKKIYKERNFKIIKKSFNWDGEINFS